MEQPKQLSTRKKFLFWGATLLSAFTVFKFLPGTKQKATIPGNDTVKMLTRDGRLVEVDIKLLASSGKKISNDELKQWIKK